MLKRRTLLTTGEAVLAALPMVRSQTAKTLKIVPQIDMPGRDQCLHFAHHGFLVFNTLVGQDSAFKAQP